MVVSSQGSGVDVSADEGPQGERKHLVTEVGMQWEQGNWKILGEWLLHLSLHPWPWQLSLMTQKRPRV